MYRKLALLLLPLLLIVTACQDDVEPPIERDLTQIQTLDTLRAVIASNSTSYFLYRGEPMGFEYELLQQFAEDYELVFRPNVVRDRDSLYNSLNRGLGDVAAGRLVPTARDSAQVKFTAPLYKTQPAVVQQTAPFDSSKVPMGAENIIEGHEIPEGIPQQPMDIEVRPVTKPSDLADTEVYLPGLSGYYDRLIELSDTISGDIEVVELGGEVSPEALIFSVARGLIELTVSQEDVAQLNESYFGNLRVKPRLGPPHQVAWAVRSNAPELQQALDEWLAEEKDSGRYNALYEKYYVDRRGYEERIGDDYLSSETGRLSDYDDLIKQHARQIDWDWRLLASQTYQESKFQPQARSWAGAMGLLQLMPGTARQYGVSDPYDPEDNVGGAVRFIEWLKEYWADKIADEDERLKFILASYNTGHGHVEDARRLTEKHGDDTTKWEDVAYWLLQKSKRQYYTDPVVKYGFCRGLEPVTYVSRILDRFEHYRQFVVDDEPEATT